MIGTMRATTVCPHCAEDVKWAAKVCPHCRRRLVRWSKSTWVWIAYGCVSVAVIGGLAACIIIADNRARASAIVRAQGIARALGCRNYPAFVEFQADMLREEGKSWSEIEETLALSAGQCTG